jgi:hypothetical protein
LYSFCEEGEDNMTLVHLLFSLLVVRVIAWHGGPPKYGGHHGCGYPGGGPTATVDNGVLIGTTTSLPAATATVNKFLGVPFAKPPVRFEPPVYPDASSETITAQEWSPACIQHFSYPRAAYELTRQLYNTPTPEESEDCL